MNEMQDITTTNDVDIETNEELDETHLIIDTETPPPAIDVFRKTSAELAEMVPSDRLMELKRQSSIDRLIELFDAYVASNKQSGTDELMKQVEKIALSKLQRVHHEFRGFNNTLNTAEEYAQDVTLKMWRKLDAFIANPKSQTGWRIYTDKKGNEKKRLYRTMGQNFYSYLCKTIFRGRSDMRTEFGDAVREYAPFLTTVDGDNAADNKSSEPDTDSEESAAVHTRCIGPELNKKERKQEADQRWKEEGEGSETHVKLLKLFAGEELSMMHQLYIEKKSRKDIAAFFGINKDTLDRRLSRLVEREKNARMAERQEIEAKRRAYDQQFKDLYRRSPKPVDVARVQAEIKLKTEGRSARQEINEAAALYPGWLFFTDEQFANRTESSVSKLAAMRKSLLLQGFKVLEVKLRNNEQAFIYLTDDSNYAFVPPLRRQGKELQKTQMIPVANDHDEKEIKS